MYLISLYILVFFIVILIDVHLPVIKNSSDVRPMPEINVKSLHWYCKEMHLMHSRDEDIILDQISIKQICLDFYYDDF